MDLSRPWAHAICDGQRSSPIRWYDGTFKSGKQRLRVCVRDGKNRNLGQGLSILQLEPLGLFGCGHSGSERIAGIEWSVQYAPPLRSLCWTHRPFGKGELLGVAV